MKKTIAFLILIASFQTAYAQQVTFGLQGGLNLATSMDKDNATDESYKFGFQLGGFVGFPLTDRLSLQPELLYSMQRAKVDFEIAEGPFITFIPVTAKLHESTIILPIFLKYDLSDVFHVKIGPQFDYLLYVKGKYALKGKNESLSDFVNKFYAGASAAMGYDLNEKISIIFKYNYSFSGKGRDDLDIGFYLDKRRNSVFSLCLAYSLN